jgi:hypothetical protein
VWLTCRPGRRETALPDSTLHWSAGRRQELMLDHGRRRAHLDQHVNEHRAPQPPVSPVVHPAVEVVSEPIPSNEGLDIVYEWGIQSFPASDPPANW